MLSTSTLLRVAQLAARSTSNRCFSVSATKAGGGLTIYETGVSRDYTHPRIGDREIVGWGSNGNESYFDRSDFPYPAIRWKSPNAPGVPELREKEMGDWTALTMDEKKALYRASFCQTFPEFQQCKKGEWKLILGVVFMGLAFSLWMWYFCKLLVYNPLPDSFSEEGRRLRLRMDIARRYNPVQGVASKWDYEKDQWKE